MAASDESEAGIARSTERDAQILRLWEAIASAADHAETLEEAAQECLDAVCSLTKWPVGHLYVVANGALLSTAVWHVDDPERYSDLRRVTASTTLVAGRGLPGEVAATGKPVWISNVTLHPNFPRGAVAGDLGVRGAFAFPILLGSEVVAVLEFFSPAPAPVDWVLLDLVARVGSQLGRVVERRRSVEQVASSDERLRRILETANESFVSMDAKGIITEWNPCAESTFGWLRHEAMGRPLVDVLIPTRYREGHLRGVERFLATGQGKVVSTTVELSALHREGHELPVELSIWAFREGGDWAFNALIRDISVRKEAQERLAASERRLAEAQRVTGTGSWEWDVTSNEVVWSDELYRIYGVAPEGFDVSYQAFLDLVDDRDRPRLVEAIAATLASGQPFDLDHRFTRPDGHLRVAHTKGEVIFEKGRAVRIRGTGRDVTERRRSEQEFQGLRSALESAVEGMAQVDPQGRYTWVNQGYAAMCGWSPEEMVGLHWTITVHPDDHDRMAAGYRTMLDVGRAALEAMGIRRDGSQFDKQVVMVSSHDDEGRFTGHVGCVQDITARRKAEEELRDLLEREREVIRRLTQLDQEKTDFVSCVSHELRTPLTSMLGYLELLTEGDVGALDPDQLQMLTVIDRNAHRLLCLIEDLLTVSQAEAGTFRLDLGDVDLHSLVRAASSTLAPSLDERQLELMVEIADDAGTIVGDADHLDRVLVNLLSNAIKFSPERGRIFLRVRRNADTVSVVVADSGIGIPDDEQPRLFERFFRSTDATRLAIPGTGLGLGIVRDIVEQHHGHIGLRSSPSHGTQITITLPIDPARMVPGDQDPDGNLPAALRTAALSPSPAC